MICHVINLHGIFSFYSKKGEKEKENRYIATRRITHSDDDCKDSRREEEEEEDEDEDLIDRKRSKSSKYNMWIQVTSFTEKKKHHSSEQLSQDCGYSSEHNISSSSLPSTPEGSEVACNDECCNHEGACHDKLNHSSSSISLLMDKGPTLTQMLQVHC